MFGISKNKCSCFQHLFINSKTFCNINNTSHFANLFANSKHIFVFKICSHIQKMFIFENLFTNSNVFACLIFFANSKIFGISKMFLLSKFVHIFQKSYSFENLFTNFKNVLVFGIMSQIQKMLEFFENSLVLKTLSPFQFCYLFWKRCFAFTKNSS